MNSSLLLFRKEYLQPRHHNNMMRSSSLQHSQENSHHNESNNDDDAGYIKTITQNYVSRNAKIYGIDKNIEMKGKSIIHPHCIIRGDFYKIAIGRYCTIGRGTIIRPPTFPPNAIDDSDNDHTLQFMPSIIGSNCYIGSDCVIESASIGSTVYIGNSCVIHERVIIKDCCYIEEGSVIPSDMIIPPFSRVRGCPAKIVMGCNEDMLPESFATSFAEYCSRSFAEFVQTTKT